MRRQQKEATNSNDHDYDAGSQQPLGNGARWGDVEGVPARFAAAYSS